MNEFEQKIFALKTLNELYQLVTETDATLNAIQITHKSSYSYIIDEHFFRTISSINDLTFTITHKSGIYKCTGKNGGDGKIAIYSTDKKDKYDG
jgi:hypothetical protein